MRHATGKLHTGCDVVLGMFWTDACSKFCVEDRALRLVDDGTLATFNQNALGTPRYYATSGGSIFVWPTPYKDYQCSAYRDPFPPDWRALYDRELSRMKHGDWSWYL